MLNKIMLKFAVSEKGAKDLVKSACAQALCNLLLMIPVALLYKCISNLYLEETISNPWLYVAICIIVLLLLCIGFYFQYNSSFFSTYRESGIIRLELAEKLRKLPLSFFDKKDSADLTTIILKDVETLEHCLSHLFPSFYGSIISTFIVLIGLLIFNWKLAFAAFWMLPISFGITYFSKPLQKHFSKDTNMAKLRLGDSIQEYFETIKDLKSNNALDDYLKKMYEQIDTLEKKTISSELKTGIIVTGSQMLFKLGIGSVCLLGINLLNNQEIDILTFFAFLLVISRIYEPLNAGLVNLAALNSLELNVERMNEIHMMKAQIGSDKLSNNGYDIVFNHVDFGYNDETKILNDVSFCAKQGEVTAIIGPSGSGKTTITRLASRFWDINKGEITVGGMDISKIDPEALLNLYSIVFQDVTLFNNSIMENIRVGKKDATDKEVIEAAKMANVDEFVNNLPDGYQTNIGENGAKLSGGERARISIARAFLKDAPIILLDEATASLDVENETKVQEALSKLIENKTVIMIAHRMRTIASADKIIVLKGGTVIEEGKPKELIKEQSFYSQMIKLQNKGSDWKIS